MPRELFSNLGFTTVTAGGTGAAPAPGTVETWTVASSSSFPAASNTAVPPTQFRVQENDQARQTEVITVTNVAGTTWTVVRGSEGTTPVVHPASFTIVQTVTAGVMQQVSDVAGVYLEAILKNGTVVVATNVMPPGLRVPAACSLSSMHLWIGTAPTGAGITVDVKRSGSTIASITLPAGSTTVSTNYNVALAKGDILTFDISAIGSTVAGSNLAWAMEGF